MREQFAAMEQEEQQLISTLEPPAAEEAGKGQHTRNQLTLWESLVETRIRLQVAPLLHR